MKDSITKGLPEDDRKEMRMLFKEAHRVRSRLTDLLDNKASESHKASLSSANYKSPSWALTQADQVGYQRGLAHAISLLQS